MTANRSRRPGFSLMMVTAVVAIASVLGLAILSSNTLQAEASASQDKAVSADALAESGLNLGLYYLQNLNDTSKCPTQISGMTTVTGSYTKSNVTLGAAVPGTFDVTFTRPSFLQYQMVATGKATGSSGAVSRTLTATVEVNYFSYAVMAPNATTALALPANTTVTGDVLAPSGSSATASGSGGGLLGGVLKLVTDVLGVTQVPGTGSVNHLLTYNINGVSGTATTLIAATLSNETRGPVFGNPAGVYYCIGNVDMNGGVKVNGTVVVASGGSLRVSGVGNAITPQRYFPAVVSDGDIKLKSNNTTLDIAGLTYTGGNLTRAGGGSNFNLNITGALLFAGAAPAIDPVIRLKVTYDRAKASVPNLTGNSLTGATGAVPSGFTIVNWKNQQN